MEDELRFIPNQCEVNAAACVGNALPSAGWRSSEAQQMVLDDVFGWQQAAELQSAVMVGDTNRCCGTS